MAQGKKHKLTFGPIEVTGKLTMAKSDKDKKMYHYEMVATKTKEMTD
jgi:hypothetical protein